MYKYIHLQIPPQYNSIKHTFHPHLQVTRPLYFVRNKDHRKFEQNFITNRNVWSFEFIINQTHIGNAVGLPCETLSQLLSAKKEKGIC